MSLKILYLREVHTALQGAGLYHSDGVLEKGELDKLPEGMRRYLRHCGYIGHTKLHNLLINYKHAAIRLKPDKDWLPLKCEQFNTIHPPTRLALMQSHMMGFIPFGARDKYQQGSGNMRIKLAGITLSDARGVKMDLSALVTYLAETPLLPTAYLVNNIILKDAGPNTIQATISDAGHTVSGSFHLNSDDEIVEFRTSVRYFSEDGKVYEKQSWSAFYENYKVINGIRMPTVMRGVWHLPGQQEYVYFKAEIGRVRYNIVA